MDQPPPFEDGDIVRSTEDGDLGLVLVGCDANGHVHVDWERDGVLLSEPETLVLVQRRPPLKEGDEVRSTVNRDLGVVLVACDANGHVHVDWKGRGVLPSELAALVLVQRRPPLVDAD